MDPLLLVETAEQGLRAQALECVVPVPRFSPWFKQTIWSLCVPHFLVFKKAVTIKAMILGVEMCVSLICATA